MLVLKQIFWLATLIVVVFLLTLIYTALFVAHPRLWWTHCTFDVEGYLQDELLPFVRACGEELVQFKESNVGKGEHACALTVDERTSVFNIVTGDRKVASVGAVVKGMLLSMISGLKELTIEDVSEVKYKVDDLSKHLIDYDSPQSVLNARASGAYNKVIAHIGKLTGTALGDAIFDKSLGASFCSLIDRDSFEALKDGKPHPTLATAFLKSSIKEDDAFIALLGACLAAPDVDEGWDKFSGDFDSAIKACTAAAELRRVYSVVGPQVRKMRMDRRPVTDLMAIFKLFNFPYLTEFNSNTSDAIDDFNDTKDRNWTIAEGHLDAFISMAESNLGDAKPKRAGAKAKRKPERYTDKPAPYIRSTLFGVHVDENGREVVVEEMSIGKVFKSIANVFKLLPKMITGIVDLVMSLITIAIALVGALEELKHGPVAFVTKVVKILLSGLLLLLLKMSSPIVHAFIFMAIGVTPLLVKLAFFTFIFGLASVSNLILAFADMSTGGMLRFLARSEDHPEAHWRQTGAHSRNVSRRMFGTNVKCFEGFSPDVSGFACVKTSRCVPIYSPSSMLIRLNRDQRFVNTIGGSTVYMHPVLPNQSVKCSSAVKKYVAECGRPVKTNGFTIPDDVIKDLVLCVCATRMHKPQTRTVCTLCELALDTHPLKVAASGYGSPIRFTAAAAAAEGGSWGAVKILLASAVASTVVVSAVYLTNELKKGVIYE
jgi:hypothetical protein